MENRKLQYQLSNGSWMDCDDRTDEFINMANTFINIHPNKMALLGKYDSVQARLDDGKPVSIGTDWYDEIRYEPAPRAAVRVDLVRCSCGHSVPRVSVMSASVGTSCPDCYDRMSK